jgi:DNA mismatch repair protein MutS
LTHLVDHLPAARNYTLAVTERGHQVIFLRQLVPGGADKSYGIQVARLAGLPERVVDRAREVLSELERSESSRDAQVTLREEGPVWALDEGIASLLHGVEEATVWTILRELYQLDIANMTPVQALVTLNELQSRLWKGREGK